MDVFCFDFDGVICDSAPETALSAWQGGRALGYDFPEKLPEALQERFCRLRPVMHTGFEAIPLMRLIEAGQETDERLFEAFPALRDEVIAREKLSREQLQKVFGEIRDRWIEEDQESWLKMNGFYSGVGEALTAAIGNHPVFIITTKQERFVELLLGHHRIELTGERIFGLERKRSKPEILTELAGRAEFKTATLHFIEDRLEALESVIEIPALRPLTLYLADWGYNTPQQRRQAAENPRIEMLSLAGCRRLCGV